MKNPTSNGNDLYQVGNDYPQIAEKYFKLESYKDGIYTEVLSAKNTLAFASATSGDTFFDFKDMAGLNKRILNVPQDEWTLSGEPISANSAFSGSYYFADEYATAKASADLGEEVKKA
jgi:hypothetical protein